MTEHCLSKILTPKAIKPVVQSSDFSHGTSGKLALRNMKMFNQTLPITMEFLFYKLPL
jgi:hypothetical protein